MFLTGQDTVSKHLLYLVIDQRFFIKLATEFIFIYLQKVNNKEKSL